MNTAIHFGAGAIGRGLVGDLLHESGYRIVLIDANAELVKQIKATNSYDLIEMEKDNHIKTIDQVYAYNVLAEEQAILNEFKNPAVKTITTAVRVENLKRIASILGKGLLVRYNNNLPPVDIMAFENAYRASETLKNLVLECTPDLNEEKLKSIAFFANTVTDRVVMAIEQAGKSIIQVGDSYEAGIEQNALADPASEPIKNGAYTNNINLILERKLYVVNGGHCACAYYASLDNYTYMKDAFNDSTIYNKVRDIMREVGYTLSVRHNIPFKDLEDYVEFALDRYLTSKNDDFVSRVARNPIRKLGKSDRLVGPALLAEELGLSYEKISDCIAVVFCFDDQEDSESIEIQNTIKDEGIETAIVKYTGFPEESALYKAVMNAYKRYKKELD